MMTIRRVAWLCLLLRLSAKDGALGAATQPRNKVGGSPLLRTNHRLLSEDAGSLQDSVGEDILSSSTAAEPAGGGNINDESQLLGGGGGDDAAPVMNMTYKGENVEVAELDPAVIASLEANGTDTIGEDVNAVTEIVEGVPGGLDDLSEEEKELVEGAADEIPEMTPTPSAVETSSPTTAAVETPNPTPAPSKDTTVIETSSPTDPIPAMDTPNPTQSPTYYPTRRPTPNPVPAENPLVPAAKPSWGDAFQQQPNNDNGGGIFAPKDASPPSSHHDETTTTTTANKPSNPLEELEHEAEEIIEDKNADIVAVILIVISVVVMIFVAQQMVENPDGGCAKLCRCSVATCRIVTYPLRLLLCCCCSSARAKERHTHDLVPTDGFDEYDHELALS